MNQFTISGSTVELPTLFNTEEVNNFFNCLLAITDENPFMRSARQLLNVAILLESPNKIKDLQFILDNYNQLVASDVVVLTSESLKTIRNNLRCEFKSQYGDTLRDYLDIVLLAG